MSPDIPEEVRRLALDPFGELPIQREVERIDLDGAIVSINPWPVAQIVRPVGVGPPDVAAKVEAARAVARERDKHVLAWWITSEHDGLAPALEDAGLVNADTPGFEAIENGLALVSQPMEQPADDVQIGVLEAWEDYTKVSEVTRTVFGFFEISEEELRQRYEDYLAARDLGVTFFAKVDDRIVAAAYAAFGTAGINLFGAGVLPEARGRGVYRSLVHARWDVAVERGTPALTVQAGRMSRPICERLGFTFVDAVRVFVDDLG